MLIFMILDISCVLAAVTFSILPTNSHPSNEIKCDCGGTNGDNNGCVCVGPVQNAYQIVTCIYAVLKFITAGMLAKIIFRQNAAKRAKRKRIKEEWIFFLRLVLSAVVLPVMGIVLVFYAATTFPIRAREAMKKSHLPLDIAGRYSAPVFWWVIAVLHALMSILFMLETILFVFCPRRYLHGGRFSSHQEQQLESSKIKKSQKGSKKRKMKNAS